MIEIPRGLARRFAVALRLLFLRGRRDPWPAVRVLAGPHGLTMEAATQELAVRHHVGEARGADAIDLDGSVLAGPGADAPLTLEYAGGRRRLARWQDKGEPREQRFEVLPPGRVYPFPEVPNELAPMPDAFLAALREAVETTADDGLRFSRVLLGGRAGHIAATDGKQLLIQSGFHLPWEGDVLVPRLPVFGRRGLDLSGPVALGRTEKHVALRVGSWTFVLTIDPHGRFPDVASAVPPPRSITSRLRIDAEDAEPFLDFLAKLPTGRGLTAAVTVELGPHPAVRACAGDGSVAELELSRSAASGKQCRLVLDRRLLARALRLGFGELEVAHPEKPVVFRDEKRTYVVMPLDPVSAAPAPRSRAAPEHDPAPDPERRPAAVTVSNGRTPADRPTSDDPFGLDEMIAEAEQVRRLLGDALARVGRLLAGLKQHRRQTRSLSAALAALRLTPPDR